MVNVHEVFNKALMRRLVFVQFEQMAKYFILGKNRNMIDGNLRLILDPSVPDCTVTWLVHIFRTYSYFFAEEIKKNVL